MTRSFEGMTALFDDLCRYLSQPMPRRTALKTVMATTATVLLISSGRAMPPSRQTGKVKHGISSV
jgi:hypothetical protein